MQKADVAFARKRAALQPEFSKMLYRCTVDGKTVLKKYHLSGILFIKKAEDKTTHVVFQNELGITYFDFSWSRNEQFKVNSIMKQMDKPALIKTLQKDFELLLMYHIPKYSNGQFHFNNDNDKSYIRYPLSKGFVYYVLDKDDKWDGIENADDKRKVVLFDFQPTTLKQLPAQITINHLRAHFTIDLKQINDNSAAE